MELLGSKIEELKQLGLSAEELYEFTMEEEEEEEMCRDCEIEAKKYCDECGGYGSCSDEEDEEDEFNETCSCGTKLSNDPLTEEEFDEHYNREPGYDDEGDWHCSDCREE